MERAVASMEEETLPPISNDQNQQFDQQILQAFADVGMDVEPPLEVVQRAQPLIQTIPKPLVDFDALEIESNRRPMQNMDPQEDELARATLTLNLGGVASPIPPLSPVFSERDQMQILSADGNTRNSQNHSDLDVSMGDAVDATVEFVPQPMPAVTQPAETIGVVTRAMMKNSSLHPEPSRSLLH